jgi:hypothetical protein
MGERDMAVARNRDQQARFDIGALEQRVYGVEKAVNDISSSIAALSTKIDERSRTPWATLIAAAGFLLLFMSTVGVLAYRPVQSDLDRHETRLNAMDERYIADLQRDNDRLRAELLLRAPK